MENKNIKNFAKVVMSYENLERMDRFNVDNQIYQEWQNANKMYEDYCNQDKELVDAQNKLKKIGEIFAENASDYFYEVVVEEDYEYDEQNDDYFAVDKQYKRYNKKKFLEAKEIAENWEDIQKDLNAEEDKIKSRKLNIFKERSLEQVNQKKAYYKAQVDKYNKYKENEDLKKYYEENEKTIVKPLRDFVDKKQTEYANKVFNEIIEEKPYLICKRHVTKPYTYTCTALDNVFNNLREEVVEFVEQKAKEQFNIQETLENNK